MKRNKSLSLVILITLLVSLLNVMPVMANPPAPTDGPGVANPPDETGPAAGNRVKPLDQPNPLDVARMRERERLLAQGDVIGAQALAQTSDRVLVVLVEFKGTDTFTWDPATSTWDPLGQADTAEMGAGIGDCSKIAAKLGLTAPKEFTYGPTLHNTIPQPLSAADRSADTIWTKDFSKDWYNAFMFGSGVVFDYDRKDGSHVHEDFTGKSVKNFYLDMSGGTYNVTGDIVGWVPVNHSEWWYGADACPGNRSGATSGAGADGGITGAGSPKSLVRDALDQVEIMRKAGSLPGFDWKNYDLDGDGVIDRLWIVHSGYGEEDGTTLINRTDYAESAIWSHSSGVTPYAIGDSGIKAGPYIIMPENGGIGVFAHEYGHNLGADDLYAYTGGETSAGFWTLMADDWTGYPIGFQPPAVDPWHLDRWGWLNPKTIVDPTQVYTVKVGQASSFPGGDGVYRGVKIALPNGHSPLAIPPNGAYYWWGGNKALMNAMMTSKNPIAVPALANATLTFNLAYGIETEWDFLWVQASTDNGATWNTLTNANTTCNHVVDWIGEINGFPADLCAAGIGGFTDYNASFPAYDAQTFTLPAATYGGQNVKLRFWYMTDWGTQYEGAFIDDIAVTSGATTLFSDNAEAGDTNWTYDADGFMRRSNGTLEFSQNYYLQWRNTTATGGYDSGLGDYRFRYGPADSGLLVWYNNNMYQDNELFNYLTDFPSFGSKGSMLVVDAHPEPYRDPYYIGLGINNEASNLDHRGQMRDAPFTLKQSNGFTTIPPYSYAPTWFAGKPSTSFFDDSQGYYPGAEFVPGGPLQTSLRWMTRQWDASVVLPSTQAYALKAPGYLAADLFRFGCERNSLNQVLCYGYPGLGYAGGSGNPGDVLGQLGWHVQILDQTASGATLRIWNTTYNGSLLPDKTQAALGDHITYTYKFPLNNDGGKTVVACAPIDTATSSFISASANVVPVTVDCASAMAAFAAGNTAPIQAQAGALVEALLWSQFVNHGASASFAFVVQVDALLGTVNSAANLSYAGNLLGTLDAPPVTLVANSSYFFPMVTR